MFGSSNRSKKRSPLHFDEFDQPDEDGEQQQEQTASSSSSQQHLAGIPEEGDVLEEPSMPFQVLMKSKDGGQQRKSPTKNGRSKSVSILEMSSNGGNMMNGNTRYGKPATGGLMDSGEVSGSDLFSEDQYAALATNLTGSSDHVPNRTLSAPPTLERHHPPSNHMLVSEKAGDSEVEQMAANYSFRHKSRLPVTLHVRKVFLIACKEKALQRQYGLRKILVEDLIDLKHAYAEEHKQHRSLCMNFPTRYLFISDEQEQMMTMYRRAVEVATTYQLYDEKGEEEFFYYEDFVFDYTRLEAKWPWFRPGLHQPLLGILFYYLITPIFFCDISRDESICHNVPSENSPGWLSAVYFASVTLSTVGYGTLTVTKNNDWNLLFGTIFMILSNVVLIVAYGSAVEQTFTKVKEFNERLINRILKETDDQDFMHKKVRRLRLAMLCQFTFQFIGVNLLGLAAVLIHLAIARSRGQEHEFADWSWMKCLYWAVQTTTTIGYGDVFVPADFRWFNAIYLMVSTYFVGNSLSGFASLSSKIDEVRRRTAWQSREVSKSMIDDMQADEHDDKIDQFEFTLASLVQLGKVDPDDVRLIMDKFRELCNDEGFIQVDEVHEMKDILEQQGELAAVRPTALLERRSSIMNFVPLIGKNKQTTELDRYLSR